MSSARNHKKRSHRSEQTKARAGGWCSYLPEKRMELQFARMMARMVPKAARPRASRRSQQAVPAVVAAENE